MMDFPRPSARDWTEDFEHENGHYICRCHECNLPFFGHKRRVICKTCSERAPERMTAARIKTAELAGAMLDYYVNLADGRKPPIRSRYVTNEEGGIIGTEFDHGGTRFVESNDWSQAGPIIERERINITHGALGWCAYIYLRNTFEGPTPLVAAMRAYVASRFGDEVEAIEGGRND